MGAETMKDCETIRVELPGYANGKLTDDFVAPVRDHLESCAACRAELGELERLDALLLEALPPITPSASFASQFANRLAAEAHDSESRSEGRRRWLGWLLQPWLIPVAAATLLAAVMLRPWFADHSASVLPAPAVSRSVNTVAAAKKPPADAKLAERSTAKLALAANNPPSEVLQRPELFVDYSVIRDLDILESGKGDGERHAG
jgi:anti-sigma factor RsiW